MKIAILTAYCVSNDAVGNYLMSLAKHLAKNNQVTIFTVFLRGARQLIAKFNLLFNLYFFDQR